jgi:hypothetical protein
MSYDADPDPTRSPDAGLSRRILIVGGVAGGASCAARLRRLDESAATHPFEFTISDVQTILSCSVCQGCVPFVNNGSTPIRQLDTLPVRAIEFSRC